MFVNLPSIKIKKERKSSICIATRQREEPRRVAQTLGQSLRFDITGIRETQGDETCDWSALLDSYGLFRRDRQGQKSRGVALYVVEGLEFMELTDGNGTVERLGGHFQVNCPRLYGGLQLARIIWEHHIAGTTRTRKFLKNLDDNFMERVLRELTWKDALLDLRLVNRVDLVSEAEIGGHLGHSDHEVIEFKISVERRKNINKTSAQDMRRADFRLLRELQSWESSDVPADWKLANVLIFKKGKKEDPGNQGPISPTSVPGKTHILFAQYIQLQISNIKEMRNAHAPQSLEDLEWHGEDQPCSPGGDGEGLALPKGATKHYTACARMPGLSEDLLISTGLLHLENGLVLSVFSTIHGQTF
ncbi:hypothetical protein BTVI_113959 [Pitangus sulphuratus]|nr:hypothetical protein BTVI_113959 [Pitangus sulphuratus]